MKTKKLLKFTAWTLIAVGAGTLILATKLLILRNTPVDFSASDTQISPSTGQNYPIFIEFKQLRLKLPVTPKNVTEGKWDDPGTSVGYWVDTPLPGQTGNSVMYGHNWPNLLANLPKTAESDTITVGFADGTNKDFEVQATYTVTSEQIHILSQSTDPRLTIYTCTGFLDFKRFVVVAIPK